MDVSVVSIDTIRPSSSHVHHLQPFNLCLIDQLTPTTYTPLIFFYNTQDFHLTFNDIIAQLKCSLSNTLDLYYPLSGRVKDNLVIDNFDAGVPYFESRVKGRLSDFIRDPQMEMLNRFLPYQNFYGQHDPNVAQVAVQVNVFYCGGIALGLCFSHKIVDGVTFSSFLKTWAAISSGTQLQPSNLFEASLMFPPRKSLPSRYTSFMHSKWFGKNLCKTRRFVFDANAVSALRTKGRSESVENPTRVEAISAFIWKYAMKALGSPRSNSVLSHTVNLRNRTEPRMSIHSIGNLIFPASATYNPEMEMEMKQLVGLVKEGLGKINSEYLKNYMCGDEGSEAVLRYLDHEISNVSSMENDPYVFSFSSWTCFGLDEIDFGWGEPVWVGLYGEVTDMSNFTVLKDLGRKNNGSIEAWISLDESIMNFLEHDPDFLAFASLNPTINMEEPNKDA